MRTIPLRPRRLATGLLLAVAVTGVAACDMKEQARSAAELLLEGPPKPDVLPQMLNSELPFRYPASLYDKKVQGNVTLRLFIDSTGRVWPESTTVAEASGFPALDSAAVRGSEALRFRPATKDSTPLNVRVLFPVFFRHPEAPALPGDTVLRQAPAADTTR